MVEIKNPGVYQMINQFEKKKIGIKLLTNVNCYESVTIQAILHSKSSYLLRKNLFLILRSTISNTQRNKTRRKI